MENIHTIIKEEEVFAKHISIACLCRKWDQRKISLLITDEVFSSIKLALLGRTQYSQRHYAYFGRHGLDCLHTWKVSGLGCIWNSGIEKHRVVN